MNHDDPIDTLSADSRFAEHEAFFNQRFVGKQLAYNPHAPMCHVTFTDGTAVYVTDTNREDSYDVNMRDHQNTGTIERAWIDETEKWDDANTYTQRLYVQCENEDEPRLLAEATFTHEPYDDWDTLYLIAFDKDEW